MSEKTAPQPTPPTRPSLTLTKLTTTEDEDQHGLASDLIIGGGVLLVGDAPLYRLVSTRPSTRTRAAQSPSVIRATSAYYVGAATGLRLSRAIEGSVR